MLESAVHIHLSYFEGTPQVIKIRPSESLLCLSAMIVQAKVKEVMKATRNTDSMQGRQQQHTPICKL
jgi:hypothetical protein